MSAPQTITQHPDLLDRRFSRIFDNTYQATPEMRSKLFTVQTARRGADEKFSNLGEIGDLVPFTGTFQYDSSAQGYDVTATHLEFGKGMAITRKMRDYDLFGKMDLQPQKLGRATQRTQEGHAARIFTMAFSNDTLFYSHSEGVPLCSNSHTTTASGVSTASGFDNLGTAALSAVAVASARIQMKGFRGDVGQIISCMPDELWYPTGLYETAWEIVNSMGKVDDVVNNANVQRNAWKLYEWQYMSDANDWFMCDSMMRKENLFWFNSVAPEFAKTGDFDTMDWKWRVYTRYSYLYNDWRWIMGHSVS